MDGVIIERIPVNRFFRKNVKFHFGMHVWTSIAEKHGVMFDEFDKIDAEQLGVDALFFAVQWGEFKDGKRRTMTEKKFRKIAEMIPAKQMSRIQKCMMDSRIGGKSIMQLSEEGAKKKQVQKK